MDEYWILIHVVIFGIVLFICLKQYAASSCLPISFSVVPLNTHIYCSQDLSKVPLQKYVTASSNRLF